MTKHFPTFNVALRSSSSALRRLKSRRFQQVLASEWGLLRAALYVVLGIVVLARVGLISMYVIAMSSGTNGPPQFYGPGGMYWMNNQGNGSWIQTYLSVCYSIIGPPPTDVLIGVIALVGLAVTARRPRRRFPENGTSRAGGDNQNKAGAEFRTPP
jgi:hypothetical protein